MRRDWQAFSGRTDHARTPGTRLGYALQLCCLRYPGRHLRRGEVLPAIMLDHVADQIGAETDVIAGFARRMSTRYDQLACIKVRFGFEDLSHPMRECFRPWLEREAIGLTDGRMLLDRFLDKLRTRRVVIPGISVVERMAAEAMFAAETRIIGKIDALLDASKRCALDALLSEQAHVHKSRFSWLRESDPRVGAKSMTAILDKLDLLRSTGVMDLAIDEAHGPRMAQFAREGVRYTAQAFQQMGPARRHAIMVATLRELEARLADAAITMLASMIARSYLRARRRLEQTIAASADQGRERLKRIAGVLEAMTRTVRQGGDVGEAVAAVASLETIEADAALLRRTTRAGHGNVLGEIAPEHKDFKRTAPRFIHALSFEGRPGTLPLRAATWSPISTVTGASRCRRMFLSLTSSVAGTLTCSGTGRLTGPCGSWPPSSPCRERSPPATSGSHPRVCTDRLTCCSALGPMTGTGHLT